MDRYFVDVYRELRDHPRICSERDAADYREILAPQPPSRAHIRRLRNADKPYFDPAIDRKPLTEETLRARNANAFFKRQMAKIGARERTIVPAPDAPRKRVRLVTIERPVQSQENRWPEPKPFSLMSDEQRDRLDKDRQINLWRTGQDVDMAEIARLWRSAECFFREANDV